MSRPASSRKHPRKNQRPPRAPKPHVISGAAKVAPSEKESRRRFLERYPGDDRPYATSYDDLDADKSLKHGVHDAALRLVKTVRRIRIGCHKPRDEGLLEAGKK
jgi:hypothetical protein